MSPDLAFVTNFCPHYRIGFFEEFERQFESSFNTKILFTDQKEGWQEYGNFEYEVLSQIPLREHYSISPIVFKKLWQYDPDIIVSGPVERFAAHASYLYARITGTPFVLWTGEWNLPKTIPRTLTFPLIKRIYDGADSFAVYGPHIGDYLTDLGVDGNRIYNAWNTTDVEFFKATEPIHGEKLRKQLGIPAESPVVLFVGRHVKEKGLEYLIDAFRQTAGKIDSKPYLLLVGDGQRRTDLKQRSSDLDNILFPGYVDNKNLRPYYGLADVFVLPSIQTEVFREPWGLVVTEAMASGTPVITSSSVGIAAAGVVQDSKTGYIVPERNVSVLADRIQRLLTEEGLRSEMGQTAVEVISKYDYERMVDGFEKAVDHAISGSEYNLTHR